MKLLLDTHIWIWFALGDKKNLGKPFLDNVQKDKFQFYISAISLWELGMLVSKGRLSLDVDVQKWVATALGLMNVKVVDINMQIALASACLSEDFHGDPADRIILATAMELNYTLASKDKKMIQFAKKVKVKVF